MTTTYLQLTAHDPIVARDGRPFGVGQGNRMRGLGWPYPSVVAGSFRTALVKATEGGDFSGGTPAELMKIKVAGVFPVEDKTLYLPAPSDCLVEEIASEEDGNREKRYIAHPAAPTVLESGEGCDWPDGMQLQPVVIAREGDFKPATGPAWWPVEKLAAWLTKETVAFDRTFLVAPTPQIRDHVQLDPATGAAAESRLFATAGLDLTHLSRFGVKQGRFAERYANITLAVRVEAEGWNVSTLNLLHPLGGERRLVHWQAKGDGDLWKCPVGVANALAGANKVRMVLATPAVFAHGWRPGWLDGHTLEGTPPGSKVRLRLVGVCIPRWKAVSGWSLAEPRGPKPVKRLVPAGGVYFFEKINGPAALAERWLKPVSDDLQDRNDGFGLAVWGTW